MSFLIGLDIGGTKIAGALFDEAGRALSQIVMPTPHDYFVLVTTCGDMVAQLDGKCGQKALVGVGVPGVIDQSAGIVAVAANTPCLNGKSLQKDLEKILVRPVRLINDADAAALSEATDGAGAGYRTVFGLIMGTGVGGGFVVEGKLVQGANGITGEFGQLLLPFREASDGPLVDCVCGQKGCIDKSVSGLALARLCETMTGGKLDAAQIAERAAQKDASALRVLDQFYTTVAKAMVVIIHTFDPEIIVVSGGLSQLPGMIEEVPKRWGRYVFSKNLRTKFAAAKHGALTGLRGAAWAGKQL